MILSRVCLETERKEEHSTSNYAVTRLYFYSAGVSAMTGYRNYGQPYAGNKFYTDITEFTYRYHMISKEQLVKAAKVRHSLVTIFIVLDWSYNQSRHFIRPYFCLGGGKSHLPDQCPVFTIHIASLYQPTILIKNICRSINFILS